MPLPEMSAARSSSFPWAAMVTKRKYTQRCLQKDTLYSVKKNSTRLDTHYTHYFFANTIIFPSMDLSAGNMGFTHAWVRYDHSTTPQNYSQKKAKRSSSRLALFWLAFLK